MYVAEFLVENYYQFETISVSLSVSCGFRRSTDFNYIQKNLTSCYGDTLILEQGFISIDYTIPLKPIYRGLSRG